MRTCFDLPQWVHSQMPSRLTISGASGALRRDTSLARMATIFIKWDKSVAAIGPWKYPAISMIPKRSTTD